MASATSPDARARARMAAGAGVVALGVACVGTSHPDVGGVILLVGWLLLGASVHAYGRASA